MSQKPSTRIGERSKPGAEIMARLEALRAAHRLGIHVWENSYGNGRMQIGRAPCFPKMTDDLLCMWHLPKENRPNFSISVMPAKSDRKCMEPWGYWGSYLLDLSEHHPDPAVIVACKKSGMVSGSNVFNKRMFPENVALSVDQMIQQCQSTDAATWRTNEVLAKLGQSHVVALAFSMRPSDDFYAVSLCAALAGLDHLRQGQPVVPVVLNVVYPNLPIAGDLMYIGASRQELRRKAIAAAKQVIQSKLVSGSCAHFEFGQGADEDNHMLWDSFERNTGLSKYDLLEHMQPTRLRRDGTTQTR